MDKKIILELSYRTVFTCESAFQAHLAKMQKDNPEVYAQLLDSFQLKKPVSRNYAVQKGMETKRTASLHELGLVK